MKEIPHSTLSALGYERPRNRISESVTSTVTELTPSPAPDLRDIIRQAEGADISEATAHAILAMIKAGGPASIMPHEFVPKATIVIRCHPDVYAHVRRLAAATPDAVRS